MNTAVFDRHGRLQGYLEVTEREKGYPDFWRAAQDQPPTINLTATDKATSTRVSFRWTVSASSRPIEQGGAIYSANVLVVQDIGYLQYIRGFKWFPEVHGEKVR